MRKKFLKSPSGLSIKPVIHDKDIALRSRLESVDITSFDFRPELPSKSSARVPSYATANFDITRLRGLEIIVFGAGSVGSYLAQALAQAQLKIHLFDSKRVEEKHTQSGRTIYDSTQIRQLKVYAAKEKIESNFIGTEILPAAYNVAELPDIDLIKRFKKAAIVILVIDDPVQIVRINRLCYPVTELVQCGIHRQGHSSHIAFTIPHQTPCLACTLGITSQRDIRRLDSEPAAGIDISIASQLAARIALDLLHSKITGKSITRWDATKNLVYISNTQQITPDSPGIHYDKGSPRRADCDICR